MRQRDRCKAPPELIHLQSRLLEEDAMKLRDQLLRLLATGLFIGIGVQANEATPHATAQSVPYDSAKYPGLPPRVYRYAKPGAPLVLPPVAMPTAADKAILQSTTSPFAISQTNPVVFHNGYVLEPGTQAYNVFWEPWDPNSYSWYNWKMNVFFGDINQSQYYNNLTQYYDMSPYSGAIHIQNSSILVASWQDTQGYPESTITPGDIANEVNRAINVNNWPADSNSQVNVFIGSGNVALGSGGPCAWHALSTVPGGMQVQITAIGYYNSSTSQSCPIPACPSACNADWALTDLAHETFEVTSDPGTPGGGSTGWWDPYSSPGEIGDKCSYHFSQMTLQNNTANHIFGPRYYLLQDMWNNVYTGPPNGGTGGNCSPYGPSYP